MMVVTIHFGIHGLPFGAISFQSPQVNTSSRLFISLGKVKIIYSFLEFYQNGSHIISAFSIACALCEDVV
jgi:hypothetical protein